MSFLTEGLSDTHTFLVHFSILGGPGAPPAARVPEGPSYSFYQHSRTKRPFSSLLASWAPPWPRLPAGLLWKLSFIFVRRRVVCARSSISVSSGASFSIICASVGITSNRSRSSLNHECRLQPSKSCMVSWRSALGSEAVSYTHAPIQEQERFGARVSVIAIQVMYGILALRPSTNVKCPHVEGGTAGSGSSQLV